MLTYNCIFQGNCYNLKYLKRPHNQEDNITTTNVRNLNYYKFYQTESEANLNINSISTKCNVSVTKFQLYGVLV